MQYNLISLEVIDFKRINAASIMFGEGITKITGANGAGKSSIIDAIFYALKADGVEMPINDQAHRAKITLRIGNDESGYTIERTVTDSGKYLTVTNDAGKKIPSPQTFLKSLYAEMADPMVFMDMKPKDQCDALRIACNCDTRALEVKHQELYDERTELNRRLKFTESSLTNLGDEPEAVEVKSIVELTNKSAELESKISEVDSLFAEGQQINTRILELDVQNEKIGRYMDDVKKQIEQLQQKLADLGAESTTNYNKKVELVAERDSLREKAKEALPVYRSSKEELEQVKDQIMSADELNRKATERQVWLSKRDQLKDDELQLVEQVSNINKAMEDIQEEKRILLESADFPVDNMIIEGDKVYVGSVPFSNLNTAEKIKVATFVAIAQNPQLKMIIIRNGSMLDTKSMKIVEEVANSKGYQIIVEKVSEDAEQDSIHIVEGQIK